MTTVNSETAVPYAAAVNSMSDDVVIAHAMSILEGRAAAAEPGEAFGSPAGAKTYFLLRLQGRDREFFSVAFLDSRHRLLSCEELFAGTIDAATVHPRVVVREALLCNAAALIFAHNHPSGDPSPSQGDEAITRRLVEACKLVDIRVLDHMVVGAHEVVSFAEQGLL